MRKPRFQRVLSCQLLSMAFLSLCAGLMFATSVAQAQAPYYARQAGPGYGVPVGYGPAGYGPFGAYGQVGTMHGGVPTEYDAALLAAYHGVDPSVVSAATTPYNQKPDTGGYGIDLSTFLQNKEGGLRAAAPPQEYLLDPTANPYRQVSAFGGPSDGRGGMAPQSVPSIGYDAAPGISVYGTPDPYNGSGGMKFSPVTPPWLTGFGAGVYANQDELLFTLGGTLKLWEGTHSVIGARILGSAATFHNGPGKVGVSVDVWGASRIEMLGVGHLVKVGGLWDQQDNFHRGGFTVAGILFPEMAKMPLTFDLAFGFGGGSDQWQNMYREVADYDAQIRMGIILFDILRVGGSIQYWQWNNPVFDPNQSSAGGYAQLNFGQWMITGDVQATRDSAQGFVNLVWTPGRHHVPLHSPRTVNVTRTNAVTKYRSWMTAAPLRDLAMRTGEAPQGKRGPSPGNPFLARGQISVVCEFTLLTDANGDGRPTQGFTSATPFDPATPSIDADTVAMDVTLVNGTNAIYNFVSVGNSTVTAPGIPPAPALPRFTEAVPLQGFGGFNIPPDFQFGLTEVLMTASTTRVEFRVGPNTNTVTFDVMVNGVTQTFSCQFVADQNPLPGPAVQFFTPLPAPLPQPPPNPPPPPGN